MIYEGKAITVKEIEGGIAQLNFDLQGESVNKFNRLTIEELRAATDKLKAQGSLKGLVVTSGRTVSSSVPISPSSPTCLPALRKS